MFASPAANARWKKKWRRCEECDGTGGSLAYMRLGQDYCDECDGRGRIYVGCVCDPMMPKCLAGAAEEYLESLPR